MVTVSEEKKGRSLLLLFAGVREMGISVFIVFLIAAVSLRSPYFLTVDNLVYILIDIAILTIVAIGETLVILTRSIDLSVASTLALSGMIVGMTISKHQGIPPAVAVLMGLAIGAVLGSVNGLLVAKGRIPPIIATLGTLSIYRGLVFAISGGAWVDAHEMPRPFVYLSKNTTLGIPNLVLFAIIVAIIFYYFLNHTRTGREIYAVGSNPSAARVVGIRVDRILFLVYLLSGTLAGMAGVLWISRYASAQSDTASGFELQAIAATVVGGVNIFGGSGTLPGVVLGSLLMGIIVNALNLIRISPFWKLAVQGFIILLAVVSDALLSRRLQQAGASEGAS
ncbi:MAG: ABC transporter permease [Anaerolineae bacterium]|nr:ABC transporter permease [Anaerolineae bacterium]